jgi:hypothetical protein
MNVLQQRNALCIGLLLIAVTVSSADPWKFGLMGDTQWKKNVDGENPNTVATGIIRQINAEFIRHGVKMVVQVGDLVDKYSQAAFDTRAQAAQELLDAGIGFFPLRGNHEETADAANYFSTAFPQVYGYEHTFGATNFQSPTSTLEGLSYSFDYNNARFVIIDQFTRKDGTGNPHDNVVDQIPWIKSVLDKKNPDTHAFVFSHKGLIGQNHMDMLFGFPACNIEAQNAFFKALYENGVRYYLCGHDHLHNRSIVASPDFLSTVKQLICASNSYKFYPPIIPPVDAWFNKPMREQPIAQELYTVGYYIFTVDGSSVTVDYYASLNGCSGDWGDTVDCNLTVTPQLSFQRRETFGYSLNGKNFIVKPNDSMSLVMDTCKLTGSLQTRAAIIDGINDVSATLYDGRSPVQDISTGWRVHGETENGFCSDVFTLWGMANEIGSEESDWYVLSLSYKGELQGPLTLMSKDSEGNWVHAGALNNDGTMKFVVGKYKRNYGPGAYGIDPVTKTVWASVNHGGEFAIVASSDGNRCDNGDQDNDGDVDNADVSIVASLRGKPASAKPSADLDNDGRITVLDARKLTLIRNR